VNPALDGTKAAAWYRWTSGRRRDRDPHATCEAAHEHPFADFDAIFAARMREADEFYADIQHDLPTPIASSCSARRSPE
jgi:hypothetical protein